MPTAPRKGLAEAVEEEGPVGQARQGVVEGLVEHGFLGRLALGDVPDVEDDALHGRFVEQVSEDHFHPAPGAIGVLGPVLDRRHRIGRGDARLPGGDGQLQVIGVDEGPAGPTDDLFGVVAEDPLDRRAHVEDVGVAVAQEGDVGRVLHQAAEPFLALGQGVQRLLQVDSRVLVLPPGDETGDALGQHEAAVDEGPLPRVVERGLVVVHRSRRDHAHGAVLDHDEADGDEEGNPVLVQAEDDDHDEVVEVHLDHAARQVHEDAGRGDQTEGGHDRLPLPSQRLLGGEEGGDGDDGRVGHRVAERVAPQKAEEGEPDGVHPEEDDHDPVPPLPLLVRQRPATGKKALYGGRGPLCQVPQHTCLSACQWGLLSRLSQSVDRRIATGVARYSPVNLGGRFSRKAANASVRSSDARKAAFHTPT